MVGGWVGGVVGGGAAVVGAEVGRGGALVAGGTDVAEPASSSSGSTVVVVRRRVDPLDLVDLFEVPLLPLEEGIRPDVFSFGDLAPGAGISPAAWVTWVTAEATSAA